MDQYPYILGCIQGTALGDAVGLRREGLSRRRALSMYGGRPLSPNLFLGRGFCSDDTEHTQMVGRALVLSKGDAVAFQRELARQLKRWLLTIPAGTGFATLRACIKLLVGFPPARSGVFSAGNGPAMRSALLGVCAESDEQMKDLVQRCTEITHTDPKAVEGATLVARAARLTAKSLDCKPIEFLTQAAREMGDGELRHLLSAAVRDLTEGKAPTDFADTQGWQKGVSGYINHTVPAALYCWAYSPNDFRQCIENAVLLGGDTDSVAAIAGAVCGANLGSEQLPSEWLASMAEWPRNHAWMESLAQSLTSSSTHSEVDEQMTQPPAMHWPSTMARNLAFAVVVLGIGFRRLLPPY